MRGNKVIVWRSGVIKMACAMKLYNHAIAPNPRRVRIFAAEKGIELALQDLDILAGQSRTPEFLAKNPSGGVPVLEFDDGSCLARTGADRDVEPADGTGAVCGNRTHDSK